MTSFSKSAGTKAPSSHREGNLSLLQSLTASGLTDLTLCEALKQGANRPGTVNFQQSDGRVVTYTFAELRAATERYAAGLLRSGLRSNDKAALILPDNETFVLTFLGCLWAGIVPVPMYPPLNFGSIDSYMAHVAAITAKAEATAVVTTTPLKYLLFSLLERSRHLKEFVCCEDIRKETTSVGIDVYATRMHHTAFLQFTSGSTAVPKGVNVTHRNLVANMTSFLSGPPLFVTPEDKCVGWLPLYHDMGLIGFVLAPIWYGFSTVLIPTLSFLKRPAMWMQAMHDHRGTLGFAPNFAYALAARRTPKELVQKLVLFCLRMMGCGAEPIHSATLQNFARHFQDGGLEPTVMMPAYGMAECTLAVSFASPRKPLNIDTIDARAYRALRRAQPVEETSDGALQFVSCGKPLAGFGVDIVDAHGQALPERHVGEIRIRGSSVAAGYFKDSATTQQAFTRHGLLTGDLGYMARGELFVTGRKKDLIIIHGRNYDPQTIEWAVGELVGIRKGNVVAFSYQKEHTEGLVVAAEVSEAASNDLQSRVADLIQECCGLCADAIVLLPKGALPKTSSGKLRRAATRTQYLNGELGGAQLRAQSHKPQYLGIAKHVGATLATWTRWQVNQRLPKSVQLSKHPEDY